MPPPDWDQTIRCLYVDDDQFLQLTLPPRIFGSVSAAQVSYDIASDGQEALDMVRAAKAEGKPYRLVLMDNQMPRMGGTVAARLLRGDVRFRGCIIGMTGDPRGCEERLEFEAAGLDICVDKDSEGVDIIVAKLQELIMTAMRSSFGNLSVSTIASPL